MCRFLVAEIGPLYRVAGHDDALMAQPSPTPVSSSETSLQLKPEQRGQRPPIQTPSRTEGSEPNSSSLVPDDAGSVRSLRRGNVAPQTCARNDLDKAIEEAQMTKDLVSVGK